MFPATGYAVFDDAPPPAAIPPPIAVVEPGNPVHVAGVAGRLLEDTTTVYTSGTLTFAAHALVFTPQSTNHPGNTGSCRAYVTRVPPFHPYFDLDVTVLRTAGAATSLNVQLDVLVSPEGGGSAALQSFHGTLELPAGAPVATSQTVLWDDGDPIHSYAGEVHNMPCFNVPTNSSGVADTQPIQLTLTSSDAALNLAILSLRFSFYAADGGAP